jgi:RNA polymerase sigma-70 factor (ECF subfamily)
MRAPAHKPEIAGMPKTGRMVPREFGDFFALHHQRVARWVGHLGGPVIEIDDAVQEVFLVAHRRLGELQAQANPAAWLFRVTENVVRNQRRRFRRQRRMLLQATDIQRQLGQLAAQGAALPATVVQRENERRLYAALDRMRERHRRLFVLFELEELSGAEIAELTGLRLSNVWVALHRARREFVAALAKVDGGSARALPFLRGGQR